jgi:nucleoid-associated protein YgaU
MRLDAKTLLFTMAAVLIAAPVYAADAFEDDAARGSMEDAQQPAMGDEMKSDDTRMGSDDPKKQPTTGADTMRSAGTQYVVEKGDTLAKIAEKKLGSAEKWKEIARANGIDDPETLRVGQKLSIPDAQNANRPQRSQL